MNTIALSSPAWDLEVDATGNIAMATGPNAIAQDVASAISTFLGEVYYDTTLGVPYLTDVLAQPVHTVMSSSVHLCAPDDSVDSIMNLMTEQRIRHVPVEDEKGRLVGLVSHVSAAHATEPGDGGDHRRGVRLLPAGVQRRGAGRLGQGHRRPARQPTSPLQHGGADAPPPRSLTSCQAS